MSLHYRAIWIANTHLTTKGCKALALRTFLATTSSDYLYIVGDNIDFAPTTARRVRTTRDDIVQCIIDKAQRGTQVVYIPGAYAVALQRHIGTVINGIVLMAQAVHVTASGARQLIVHGDEFANLVHCAERAALAEQGGVNAASASGRLVIHSRAAIYTQLESWLARQPAVIPYVHNVQARRRLARQLPEVDGIICGHIHANTRFEHICAKPYRHCGDWVEHCSALVETAWGQLELLHWPLPTLADQHGQTHHPIIMDNTSLQPAENAAWRFFSRQQ